MLVHRLEIIPLLQIPIKVVKTCNCIPPLHGLVIATADEPTDSSIFWNKLVCMCPG